MDLDFPGAFEPLRDVSLRVLAAGSRSTEAADALSVPGSVREADSQRDGVAGGARGELWTVSFAVSDWVSPRRPSRGARIVADDLSGRWPRLTVQKVTVLGGIYYLECSARERGAL